MALFQSCAGFDYSTTEQKTGAHWIDGKPTYIKVVNLGALPNATSKDVAHGISNLETIVTASLFAYSPSVETFMPIPFVAVDSTGAQVRATIGKTAVTIQTGSNRSAFSIAHAIIEYTKTTD